MKVLGSPKEMGNSDVIVSRESPVRINEGLVVALDTNGKIKKMAGGATPYGVMGEQPLVGCSVVLSGLGVWTQCEADCVPVAGAQVFVKAETGKVTSVSEGNIPTRATFSNSEAASNDGLTTNEALNKAVKCCKIDFVGGF